MVLSLKWVFQETSIFQGELCGLKCDMDNELIDKKLLETISNYLFTYGLLGLFWTSHIYYFVGLP